MIGSIQLSLVGMKLTLPLSFSLILSLGKNSIGTSMFKLVSVAEANLATTSALLFSSLEIYVTVYSTKLSNRPLTFLKYSIILSSFAWYSDLTWFIINCESLFISSLSVPISFAHLSSVSSALYFTLLLEA